MQGVVHEKIRNNLKYRELSAKPFFMSTEDRPYIAAENQMAELTPKAFLMGLLMSVIVSAANAYLGLKAGMTISAMFPAAVVAMAVFRLPFCRGTLLEENIARTSASVGEALAAGAVFTVPAFLMAEVDGQKLWSDFRYWQTTGLTMVGGGMGVLMVIFLRRTLVQEMNLPYPEGFACFEMVKSGQKGESGAKSLVWAMGIGGLIQLLKDSRGITLIRESTQFVIQFASSVVRYPDISDTAKLNHVSSLNIVTPSASPAMMAIGWIINFRYSVINFSGALFAWYVLIPLSIFVSPDLPNKLGMPAGATDWSLLSNSVWYSIVRPIAVGAMLLATLHTLWNIRHSLLEVWQKLWALGKGPATTASTTNRLEFDLSPRFLIGGILILTLLFGGMLLNLQHSVAHMIGISLFMVVIGFVFSIIGAYTVGLVGSSNQPISGLALCGLILTALLMLALKVPMPIALATTLSAAVIICCASALSGDMVQNLKVGQLLGATPRKMQLAEFASVICTAFIVMLPILLLHKGNLATGGIGGSALPAPQAGLMAMLTKGMLGGEMPWLLIVAGIFFALFLIMIGAPSPMMIALGMYLPIETSFAMFTGGLMRWGMELFEGTNISEGRGTTRPFELFGAPFVDAEKLTTQLNRLKLPGVFFRPAAFQPTFDKWQGKLCQGAQIHITQPRKVLPVQTAVAILQQLLRQHHKEVKFNNPPYEYEETLMPFDILAGSSQLREQLQNDIDLKTIVASWRDGCRNYWQRCKPARLY